MRKKRVAILGSTGSIGVNTLDIVRRHADRFEAVLLSAFNNVTVLERQVKAFRPKKVALLKRHIPLFRRKAGQSVRFFNVETDLPVLVAGRDIDIVVIAMPGAVALGPFLSAVTAGKTVAPANKEALVMAGDIIMAAARKNNAQVIPVDSEQSAIFQCLQGQRRKDLSRVHLTASGGPLLNVSLRKHDRISVEDILRHPRWKMGAKITVDSATLMNKGFELIEAQRLFGLKTDEVKVVIHPEALIHSMVEYVDGSILAQAGQTDMRIPIQYALTYPERMNTGLKPLNFAKLGTLTFEEPDLKRFPSLGLCSAVSRAGGTAPAVLNAADEVAVEAFLGGRISFTKIYKIVEQTVRSHKINTSPTLTGLYAADAWGREKAAGLVGRRKWRS